MFRGGVVGILGAAALAVGWLACVGEDPTPATVTPDGGGPAQNPVPDSGGNGSGSDAGDAGADDAAPDAPKTCPSGPPPETTGPGCPERAGGGSCEGNESCCVAAGTCSATCGNPLTEWECDSDEHCPLNDAGVRLSCCAGLTRTAGCGPGVGEYTPTVFAKCVDVPSCSNDGRVRLCQGSALCGGAGNIFCSPAVVARSGARINIGYCLLGDGGT
jgi:hypothetical protein